jgi:predicted ester cyclase
MERIRHRGCRRDRQGPKQHVGGLLARYPDLHVDVLHLIAEDDRVVARNRWSGTEAASGVKHQFSGIVIWRIAHRQFVETVGMPDTAAGDRGVGLGESQPGHGELGHVQVLPWVGLT